MDKIEGKKLSFLPWSLILSGLETLVLPAMFTRASLKEVLAPGRGEQIPVNLLAFKRDIAADIFCSQKQVFI